jgi:hypothetical protein
VPGHAAVLSGIPVERQLSPGPAFGNQQEATAAWPRAFRSARRSRAQGSAWIKAPRKEFLEFPLDVRIDMETALAIAARGGKADTAKPFKGVHGGVFEIVSSIEAMLSGRFTQCRSARTCG